MTCRLLLAHNSGAMDKHRAPIPSHAVGGVPTDPTAQHCKERSVEGRKRVDLYQTLYRGRAVTMLIWVCLDSTMWSSDKFDHDVGRQCMTMQRILRALFDYETIGRRCLRVASAIASDCVVPAVAGYVESGVVQRHTKGDVRLNLIVQIAWIRRS
jgi:hypothetical protein